MSLSKRKIKELQESTGHSVFSPSSLKRIMLCPGSVLAELHSPIPEESTFAAEGTLLHDYMETAFLKMPMNPVRYINEQNWTQERKTLCIDAAEFILNLCDKHSGTPNATFESKGTLAAWGLPEVYGTMDVKLESDKRLDVADYKFGYGIQVFAEDNPQCGAYLASGIDYADGSIPEKTLATHIVQPTLNHYDTWDVEWEDLCSLILVDITKALTDAKSVDPSYHSSMESCRWCNAKMTCEHRKKSVRQKAQAVIKAAKNPATAATKKQWKIILDGADDLQQAIKDVRIYAQAEIRSGRGFPGYKLVAGRSQRKFKNQEEGETYIMDRLPGKAFIPRKVISLAQAEKKLPGLKKDGEWKDLITKPQGKDVLVAESDKRAALEFGAAALFADDVKEITNVSE